VKKRKRVILDIGEIVEDMWRELIANAFEFDHRILGDGFSKVALEKVIIKRIEYTLWINAKEPAKPQGYCRHGLAEKEYGISLGLNGSNFAEAMYIYCPWYEEIINDVNDLVSDNPYNIWLLQDKGSGVWILEDVGDIRIKQWEEEHLDENGNYTEKK
jgi:hypothetical protein